MHSTESSITDYETVRESIRTTLERALDKGGHPERAAQVIVKVAQSSAPRFRYGTGSGTHWLPYLSTLCPQSLLDYLLSRGFGLAKVKRR